MPIHYSVSVPRRTQIKINLRIHFQESGASLANCFEIVGSVLVTPSVLVNNMSLSKNFY